MTHFGNSGANGDGLLAVEISGSNFGFGRRAHHIVHDFGHSVKRAIRGQGQRRRFQGIERTQSEKEVAARAAAGFRLGEVQGVTVDVQYHVAGGVANGRFWVSGGIVEQPQGFVVCFVGALGLGCSDGTEGDEHGDVDGDLIVEESPNNLLEKADGLWRKREGVVNIFRLWHQSPVRGKY